MAKIKYLKRERFASVYQHFQLHSFSISHYLKSSQDINYFVFALQNLSIMTESYVHFLTENDLGHFSTATFWLGPSLDWQSPHSHLMGFLCSTSLGAVESSNLLMFINVPPGSLHDTYTTLFNNARISNVLSLKLNLINSYPCYI